MSGLGGVLDTIRHVDLSDWLAAAAFGLSALAYRRAGRARPPSWHPENHDGVWVVRNMGGPARRVKVDAPRVTSYDGGGQVVDEVPEGGALVVGTIPTSPWLDNGAILVTWEERRHGRRRTRSWSSPVTPTRRV
jgi:hypothetical protein